MTDDLPLDPDATPSDDTPSDDATGFADLGLRVELLDALNTLGYEEPTPIQRETIPTIVSGKDLLGQAATGTGKTAAFALPILERLVPEAEVEPVAEHADAPAEGADEGDDPA